MDEMILSGSGDLSFEAPWWGYDEINELDEADEALED